MTNWAIDANIVMQQAVRRLLGACVEHTNGRIFVPERVLALACHHYKSIARRRARRITRWQDEVLSTPAMTAERDELIVTRALAMQHAFSGWANAELQRNDGLWASAPATLESQRIAQRLFISGIARGGHAARIEEDAEAAAQALDAGCRWIASHNLDMLQGAPFERWLTDEQTQGRLRNASAPFICPIDDAIHQMLGTEHEAPAGRELLAAISWELTRPDHPDRARDTAARLAGLERFTEALHQGGAVRSAAALDAVLGAGTNNPDGLRADLERHELHESLGRTRAAERRQVRAEREAIRAATPTPLPVPTPWRDADRED